MTHEPVWLLEWFWQRTAAANLRQLVRGHLRGRARVHLAGEARGRGCRGEGRGGNQPGQQGAGMLLAAEAAVILGSSG